MRANHSDLIKIFIFSSNTIYPLKKYLPVLRFVLITVCIDSYSGPKLREGRIRTRSELYGTI